MKKVVKTLFILFVICKAMPSYGQKPFHLALEYNYLYGFCETNQFWTKKTGMNGFDFSLIGMYDFSDRLSAGVGIGAEKLYKFPTYTVFPVFAKVAYSPIPLMVSPYVYTRIGYGVGTDISNPGLLFNPGIGYKLKIREHFSLNFTLGYHLQTIRYDIAQHDKASVVTKTTDHSKRHSLSCGIGLIF